MQNTALRRVYAFLLGLSLCVARLGHAQQDLAPPVNAASAATTKPQSGPAVDTAVDPNFVNQLLSIINDAVITKLDAQVSLESAKVERGRVRLQGLRLRNFNLGLRLNAGGARRLAEVLQNHFAPNAANQNTSQSTATQAASAQAAPNQWTTILQILKLGLFNRLDFSVRLHELRIKELALDTDALDIEGLLLKVGATPNDPVTGKPRNDTLAILIDILRHTALTHIKAHAGLDKLAARRVHLILQGTALEGLSINVALLRADDSSG